VPSIKWPQAHGNTDAKSWKKMRSRNYPRSIISEGYNKKEGILTGYLKTIIDST